MSKRILTVVLSVVALQLAGCAAQTYNKQTESIPAVNVPDQLKGNWTYSLDDSIREAKRSNFKPSGQVCSLHTFNLDSSAAIESVMRRAMQDFIPAGSESRSGSPMHIAFRIESFQPRFSCTIGATEPTCTGVAEITLAATVVKDGNRRSFSVTSERSADMAGGNLCSTALNAPSEAVRKATRDAAERAMERILMLTK